MALLYDNILNVSVLKNQIYDKCLLNFRNRLQTWYICKSVWYAWHIGHTMYAYLNTLDISTINMA